MSLPWFRLYRELKDDPKIGVLSDSEFRVFIESLCWACEKGSGGGLGMTVTETTWAFRRNVTETFQSLIRHGLLFEKEDGELCVTKWKERQKPSDSSAERVRKHREKQRVTFQPTLLKQKCSDVEERRGDENRVEGVVADEPLPTPVDFVAVLEKSSAYSGIAVRREFEKMAVWCQVNHKKPTERRFVAWLNRVEQPMPGATGGPKKKFGRDIAP
jgi:hypothetical protein